MESKINIDSYKLKDLKCKFENRDFAIPEIQRQYVWNKQRVCSLMDSIYKNYPIGISLVWNAPFSKAIHIRPNNKTIIPPFNKLSKKSDLIIDGQQRLSTLYGILYGTESKPEANLTVNFKNLVFNYNKKDKSKFSFSKKQNFDSEGYISLTELINTTPSILKRRFALNKREFVEVQKCYRAFNDYKFYILTFKGLDFKDIREIFIRINSAGMKVSRADTLFAKATRVDLRHNMLDTRRGLKHGFNNISIDALQNTLGLAYGATRVGNQAFKNFLDKIDENKNNNKEFNKIWEKLQYGYEETVDFLINTLKIGSAKQLPSQNIYSLLAYFFYLKQSRASIQQIKELKKWFWHTSCGERYSGASFNRNIPNDIKFFKRLAEKDNSKYIITEKINLLDYLKSGYQNSGSSAVNSYFIMLRTQKPLYLINGEEIPLDHYSSISNRKDRHHIYPKNLLERNKVSTQWKNSIANICYLEADENVSISNSHPYKYLNNYKKLKKFYKVMQSHLIPADSKSPVWDKTVRKGFLNFLNLRGELIMQKIEHLANGKIFYKFDGIKRI
jgi:hypothetical protein